MIAIIIVDARYRNNTGQVSVVYNENDTILTTSQINSATLKSISGTLKKISWQLILKQSQPIHVVRLYTTSCNELITHSSILHTSATFTIKHAALVYLPTYVVTGSKFEIVSDVLCAQLITTEITLYVLYGLDLLQNFSSNLQKSVYSASIYISRSGSQNTSTNINYTVTQTGYYFIVIDATDSINTQLDVTLNRTFYDPSDYKKWCVIHDYVVCELSSKTPLNDKEVCVLADVVKVPDVGWTPAYIEVEKESEILTAVTVIPIVLSFIFIISVIILCALCFVCKIRRRKST